MTEVCKFDLVLLKAFINQYYLWVFLLKMMLNRVTSSYFTWVDCRFSFFIVRALLLILHGLGEHCLWYTDMAEFLNKHGIYVFAHDHGRV